MWLSDYQRIIFTKKGWNRKFCLNLKLRVVPLTSEVFERQNHVTSSCTLHASSKQHQCRCWPCSMLSAFILQRLNLAKQALSAICAAKGRHAGDRAPALQCQRQKWATDLMQQLNSCHHKCRRSLASFALPNQGSVAHRGWLHSSSSPPPVRFPLSSSAPPSLPVVRVGHRREVSRRDEKGRGEAPVSVGALCFSRAMTPCLVAWRPWMFSLRRSSGNIPYCKFLLNF